MFKTDDVTVLLAAAGAGKTTYLIDCVEKDLKTYRPEDLAFVSYTRKGAYEGKDRIIRKFNLEADQLDYFRTLHSLTFTELNLPTDRLFNGKHIKKFNDIFGFKLSSNLMIEARSHHDKMLHHYDSERSGMVDFYEDVGAGSGYTKQEYVRFVNAYELYKKKFEVYDFTDCLDLFVKRKKRVPVKVAYIDEAQDLTTLQWQVCFTAFHEAEKIYIAGDDYQSIYTYAGAKPKFLVQLSDMYKTVKLETSYRLPDSVYRLSKAVTDLISVKVDKDYKPFKSSDGKVERVNEHGVMAAKIAAKADESWLVLFRNNYHITFFEKELQAYVIPYHNSRGFCIGTHRINLLRKYYNFRKMGFSTKANKELFAQKYGIEDFGNDVVESELIEGDDKYIIQAYLDKYGIDSLYNMSKEQPKIFLSTVHRVKGAEAKNVAFFMDCTKKVFSNLIKDLDSEMRVMYVALTRAKENLYLVRSASSYGLDETMNVIMEYAGL